MHVDCFEPSRVPPEWRNYCVYSGRQLAEAAISAEHVIPRSLGGSGATVIRCSKAVNSKVGHEIDAKVANDPIIIFGRRDSDARGNSGKKPRAILKGAAAWRKGDPWGEAPPKFNIEIPGNSASPIIYDTRTGKNVPYSSDTGFIIQDFKIDSLARTKFVAKTLLGFGWKLFGLNFLSAGQVDSLRTLIGTREEAPGQARLYYLDQFTLGEDDQLRRSFQVLQDQTVRRNRTTVLMRHTEFGLEWSVSCLGYFVGSLIYPCASSSLLEGAPINGGILLTVTRDRLVFDFVKPFPAPWGPSDPYVQGGLAS